MATYRGDTDQYGRPIDTDGNLWTGAANTPGGLLAAAKNSALTSGPTVAWNNETISQDEFRRRMGMVPQAGTGPMMLDGKLRPSDNPNVVPYQPMSLTPEQQSILQQRIGEARPGNLGIGGGTTSSGSSIPFQLTMQEAQQYLANNPDVANAWVNRATDPNQASVKDKPLDQWASEHWGRYGEAEHRSYQPGGALPTGTTNGFTDNWTGNAGLDPTTTPAGGSGGTGGNLGFGGGTTMRGYQVSPYLNSIADDITRRSNDNLQNTVLPGIRGAAQMAGGYGGSRQGIAEGLAVGQSQDALSGALANLYGQDYQADRGRALQEMGLNQQFDINKGNLGLGLVNSDRNYDLGVRSSDLGFANLDRAINNDNLGWQVAGANLGMNAINQGNQWAQNTVNAGTTIQNTPMDYWSKFTNAANGIGNGFGTSTQSMDGNPWLGALAGWNLGSGWGNKK